MIKTVHNNTFIIISLKISQSDFFFLFRYVVVSKQIFLGYFDAIVSILD